MKKKKWKKMKKNKIKKKKKKMKIKKMKKKINNSIFLNFLIKIKTRQKQVLYLKIF